MPLLDNLEFFVQRLKFLFLCSLLSWTNLFIKHTSMFLVDFIDWWGRIEGWSIFVFLILFSVVRRPLYTPSVLWCAPFGVFIQFALIQKKKKLCTRFLRSGSWSLNLGLWERSRKTNLDSSKSSDKIWPENEEEEVKAS